MSYEKTKVTLETAPHIKNYHGDKSETKKTRKTGEIVSRIMDTTYQPEPPREPEPYQLSQVEDLITDITKASEEMGEELERVKNRLKNPTMKVEEVLKLTDKQVLFKERKKMLDERIRQLKGIRTNLTKTADKLKEDRQEALEAYQESYTGLNKKLNQILEDIKALDVSEIRKAFYSYAGLDDEIARQIGEFREYEATAPSKILEEFSEEFIQAIKDK